MRFYLNPQRTYLGYGAELQTCTVAYYIGMAWIHVGLFFRDKWLYQNCVTRDSFLSLQCAKSLQRELVLFFFARERVIK